MSTPPQLHLWLVSGPTAPLHRQHRAWRRHQAAHVALPPECSSSSRVGSPLGWLALPRQQRQPHMQALLPQARAPAPLQPASWVATSRAGGRVARPLLSKQQEDRQQQQQQQLSAGRSVPLQQHMAQGLQVLMPPVAQQQVLCRPPSRLPPSATAPLQQLGSSTVQPETQGPPLTLCSQFTAAQHPGRALTTRLLVPPSPLLAPPAHSQQCRPLGRRRAVRGSWWGPLCLHGVQCLQPLLLLRVVMVVVVVVVLLRGLTARFKQCKAWDPTQQQGQACSSLQAGQQWVQHGHPVPLLPCSRCTTLVTQHHICRGHTLRLQGAGAAEWPA